MQSFFKKLYMTGDFWGGIAAMLVALPAAIAFGVTIAANKRVLSGMRPTGQLHLDRKSVV